jgi:hypothetical protein
MDGGSTEAVGGGMSGTGERGELWSSVGVDWDWNRGSSCAFQ